MSAHGVPGGNELTAFKVLALIIGSAPEPSIVSNPRFPLRGFVIFAAACRIVLLSYADILLCR